LPTEPGEVEHGFSGNTTLVQAAAKDLARIRNLIAPQMRAIFGGIPTTQSPPAIRAKEFEELQQLTHGA
jgi:hypothetical protein